VVGLTVIEAPVSPVDQEYDPPVCEGVAVSVADSPEQIVKEFTVTVGAGLTVTVPVPVAGVHPPKE
jgi:hypothetical protein